MIEPGKTWPLPSEIVAIVDGNGKHGVDVGKDGGAQSALGGLAPTLVPPEALLALSWVVGKGAAKYAVNNWRAIPEKEHLDHALVHVYLHMAGDKSERHLWNALCRLAFAVAVSYGTKDYRAYDPLPVAQEPASVPALGGHARAVAALPLRSAPRAVAKAKKRTR